MRADSSTLRSRSSHRRSSGETIFQPRPNATGRSFATGASALRVPPSYLFCLEMMDATVPFEFLTALNIDLARVLHGEQRFDYHAPVVVGDVLTFRPRVRRRRRDRADCFHRAYREKSAGAPARRAQ